MKNRVKDALGSRVINVTLAATTSAGDIVQSGDFVGIAVNSGVSGDVVAVETDGAFSLTSTAGSSAVAQGGKLYWDGSAQEVKDTNAGTDILIGRALEASAMAGAPVIVRLIGIVA